MINSFRRTIRCVENATWQSEPYLEGKCYPWLYPYGKGGEADPDPTWIFRALNLLQREDLRRSVNFHAKKKYQDGKMCYLIYPGKLLNCI